ncbi:uncharacterized protein TM35_000531220, partial [Trypanosoma theileri]
MMLFRVLFTMTLVLSIACACMESGDALVSKALPEGLLEENSATGLSCPPSAVGSNGTCPHSSAEKSCPANASPSADGQTCHTSEEKKATLSIPQDHDRQTNKGHDGPSDSSGHGHTVVGVNSVEGSLGKNTGASLATCPDGSAGVSCPRTVESTSGGGDGPSKARPPVAMGETPEALPGEADAPADSVPRKDNVEEGDKGASTEQGNHDPESGEGRNGAASTAAESSDVPAGGLKNGKSDNSA